jgi:hypothetical protein
MENQPVSGTVVYGGRWEDWARDFDQQLLVPVLLYFSLPVLKVTVYTVGYTLHEYTSHRCDWEVYQGIVLVFSSVPRILS